MNTKKTIYQTMQQQRNSSSDGSSYSALIQAYNPPQPHMPPMKPPHYQTHQQNHFSFNSPISSGPQLNIIDMQGEQSSDSMGAVQQQQQLNRTNYNSAALILERPPLHSNTQLMLSARSETFPQNDLLASKRQLSPRDIDSQGERLKYLDNYRLICEKRIRDLAPSHPLPVLPSHCGKPNPDLEELKTRLRLQNHMIQESTNNSAASNLNQNIEYVKLRAQVDQVMGEKAQIEDALRQETLANEEQRNYISILRNAIDQKMDSLGLLELINAKNQQQMGKPDDPVTIYTLLSELQRDADTWKRQCKNLEDQAISAEEVHRSTAEQNHQLTDTLGKLEQECKRLNDEVKRLSYTSQESMVTAKNLENERKELGMRYERNVSQIEKLQNELTQEKSRLQTQLFEHDELKTKYCDLQARSSSWNSELIETKAIIKYQEEQLTSLKEELKTIKRTNLSVTDLDGKVKDLEQNLQAQQKASLEKSSQIDLLRGSIRQLEDQIFKAQSELTQVSEDYALRAKRQSLEEDSLKKRLLIHDKNSKELGEKLREAENRHQQEMEQIKAQSEIRVGELIIEKSEIKEKLMAIERQSFLLKKERDDCLNSKESAEGELKVIKQQMEAKTQELGDVKAQFSQFQHNTHDLSTASDKQSPRLTPIIR